MRTRLHSLLEDLDFNFRERAKNERQAVETAQKRRDTAERELERLKSALDAKKQEAETTDILADAGVDAAEPDVAPIEEGVEKKRKELQEAEEALAEAKAALEKKHETLRDELAEAIRKKRDEAEQRVADGLSEAVRGNLQLWGLSQIAKVAALSVGVEWTRKLLPPKLQGHHDTAAQTAVATDLSGRVQRQTDSGQVSPQGFHAFRADVRKAAREAAPLGSKEEDGPFGPANLSWHDLYGEPIDAEPSREEGA